MSVADGLPQDWAALEEGAGDERTRRALENLRVVAGIAEFHRSVPAPEPSRGSDPGERSIASARSTVADPNGPVPEASPVIDRWGRFRLLRKLGEGTYGEVYCAHDTQLDQEVALKLLRPSRSSTEPTRRLLGEARMLARVRHPNVASVYGAEEHAGRAGLWMELIRGVTLEELVQSHGPLGASEAALVGQDICRALAAVHSAGLVHRDVKTGNVMREEGGRIVLTDFGAGGFQRYDPEHRLAGTPLYMAPEVIAGAEATPQSDIYSVGVVLFRLVTGRYPVTAGRLDELLQEHVRGTTQSLLDLRPDLPSVFVATVEQALARDPAERQQSAGALRAALGRGLDIAPNLQDEGSDALHTAPDARTGGFRRRPLTTVLAGTLAACLAAYTAFHPAAGASGPPLPLRSIAVLPFVDPGEAADAGIGRRLAEDVSRRLSQRGVRAIGGVSSNLASGLAADQIGRRLGVDAVLRGDLERDGPTVVASLRLLRADTGSELWSGRYREREENTARLPDAVVADISGVIGANPGSRSFAHTPSLAAYKAYASGRLYAEQRNRNSLSLAIRYYQSASHLDPGYAEPWAGIADAYVALGVATFGGMRPQEARRLAKEAAINALELEPSLAEAHTSLAFQAFLFDWDWAAAEERFRRAIALNPYYAGAHHWYANHLNAMGRQREAMLEFEKAVELEPLSILIQRDRGWHLFNQRRYGEAATALLETLEVQPDYAPARSLLGRVLVEEGLFAQGIRELERAAAQTPAGASLPLLAYAHAAAGERRRAREELARVEALGDGEFVSPYYIALVCLRLGQTDETFRWLEKAYQEQDTSLVNLKIDPRLGALHGVPRYESMLRRMNFPP